MLEKLTLAWMGKSTPRVEDARLLRGAGKFLDDVKIEHVLAAVFVRSPIAHGKIKSIGLDAARSLPGVHAVLGYADIRPLLQHDRIPMVCLLITGPSGEQFFRAF